MQLHRIKFFLWTCGNSTKASSPLEAWPDPAWRMRTRRRIGEERRRRRRGLDEEGAIMQLGATMPRQKFLYPSSLRFIHLHCPLFLSAMSKNGENSHNGSRSKKPTWAISHPNRWENMTKGHSSQNSPHWQAGSTNLLILLMLLMLLMLLLMLHTQRIHVGKKQVLLKGVFSGKYIFAWSVHMLVCDIVNSWK